MKRPTSTNRELIVNVGIIVILLVLAIGLRLVHRTKNIASADTVVTQSTDKPSEIEPAKAGYAWAGAPDDPKEIRLPSIGVKGFIQKVGVDQNNQIAVPTNIFLAGWFIDSVKPGQPGLSIIDGHLDGYARDGIFIHLDRVKAGNIIEIEKGNGEVVKYAARTVTSIDTDKAAAELFSQNPRVRNQLNLITCGGKFDATKRSYDKRVIVTAELVD